jgi:hypothetical protein
MASPGLGGASAGSISFGAGGGGDGYTDGSTSAWGPDGTLKKPEDEYIPKSVHTVGEGEGIGCKSC